MNGRLKKFGISAVLACALIGAAIPSFANGEDPLISLSYLNQRLEAIEAKIKEGGQRSGTGATSSALELVNLEAGDELIVAQGTQMILRSGSCSVIASELGGLSDITDGVDLKQGTLAPANHMFIAPRSDGRGLSAEKKAIVMVSGSYHIKKSN